MLMGCNPLPDLASGDSDRVIWKVPIRGWTGPAFDDSLAFFGAFAHEVVAVDKRTGKIRWRSLTNGPLAATSGDNLVIAGGTVVAPDDLLYGFDRKTGVRKWVFEPDSGFLPGIFLLDTDGQRVYAGSPSGYAYAVDGETGKQIWATNVTGAEKSSVYNPVFNLGVVAVTIRRFTTTPVTGGISLLDASTGKVLWHREFSPEGPAQESGSSVRAAFYGQLVIVSADDGRVYGLDRATGGVVWTAPARTASHSINDTRPVIIVGSTVVVGTNQMSLAGLDPATGAKKWDTNIGNGSLSHLFRSDGTTAYTTTSGLYLIAVDGASGRLKWSTPPFDSPEDARYWGLPAVDSDRIYMSGTSGLYALPK